MNIENIAITHCNKMRLAGIYLSHIWLAATYDEKFDAVLKLSWSMPETYFDGSDVGLSKKDINISISSRPADTSILINRELFTCAEIEDKLINLAWKYGAHALARIEKAPLEKIEDYKKPQYGLLSHFGVNSYVIANLPLIDGDSAPTKTLEKAASDGFVVWGAKPVFFASPLTKKLCKDKSLNNKFMRDGNPNIGRQKWFRPRENSTGHEHHYEFFKK